MEELLTEENMSMQREIDDMKAQYQEQTQLLLNQINILSQVRIILYRIFFVLAARKLMEVIEPAS